VWKTYGFGLQSNSRGQPFSSAEARTAQLRSSALGEKDVLQPQKASIKVSDVLLMLFGHAIHGRAHLTAAKSIIDTDKIHPELIRVSYSFFFYSTLAHLESAQLCAARLFDGDRCVTAIPWLLARAKERFGEFAKTDKKDADEWIKEAEETREQSTKVLAALKLRRDRSITHLDREVIKNPKQFAEDSKLTYDQLALALYAASDILNILARLCHQAGFEIHPDDYNDLSKTIELMEKGFNQSGG
jgi:hypothetical protein